MNKRTIYGLLILGIGVLALAGSLGMIQVKGLWPTFWPVILIAIGLINLADQPRNIIFSIGIAVVGVVFLLKNLGFNYLAELDLWNLLWPVIIILVGLQLLTSKSIGHLNRKDLHYGSDDFDIIRIFSGEELKVTSKDFTGGDVVTIFGGANIDLREAEIRSLPARMDVVCIFGGADIVVPKDWHVKVTGVPIFGGWGNKTDQKNNSERPIDLEISAVTIFGGMDVKN